MTNLRRKNRGNHRRSRQLQKDRKSTSYSLVGYASFVIAAIVLVRRNDNIARVLTLPPSLLETTVAASAFGTADNKKNLAYEQSYGLLNNISNTQWEELRQKTKQRSWFANPENPLDRIDDTVWWNAHNLLPTFDCPQLGRIGSGPATDKEGTKMMCAPQNFRHRGDCLIYSIGSAGNYRWEDDVAKMHNYQCEIHVFDPADSFARPGDVENKNIHYHAWGIVSSYDQESKSVVWPKGRGGGFKTFAQTLEELNHKDRIMDIFKIDCEGCEWSSHKDWIGHGMRQILIETHGVPTPRGTPKARWYQRPMNVVEDYWKDFADNGYALYSRDPNGELGMELAFMKLTDDFWKDDS